MSIQFIYFYSLQVFGFIYCNEVTFVVGGMCAQLAQRRVLLIQGRSLRLTESRLTKPTLTDAMIRYAEGSGNMSPFIQPSF